MSGRVDPKKLARAIETELELTGSSERAAGEKRYLKSDMDFLGATLADIRRVARQAANGLDRERAVRLAEELWSVPTFERRMAAALILELHADDLRSEDLTLIERLIRESRTWALVDVLSGDVIGEMGLPAGSRRGRTGHPASRCARASSTSTQHGPSG
jgi:3-methyladenine DNA glycosylase AlkD